MQNSLREIAKLIDKTIADDSFPEGIRPDYLYDAVRDYPLRKGKRLRPALVFWCGQLFDADAAARLLYPAAAVEIFHNWTLVHDDIIDRDDMRRGEPSCHIKLADALQKFSLPEQECKHMAGGFAILTGDLQQAWALDLLRRSTTKGVHPDVVSGMIANMLHLGSHELISGEALDMELSLRPLESVTLQEAETMIDLKTGALLRLAAETGAMAALQTADPETPEVAQIGTFAQNCGKAFQLRDDLLGIYGNEPKLGKPVGADLREAKRTPLLLMALRGLPDSGKQELQSLLHRDFYTPEMLADAQNLIEESGAKSAVEQQISQLADSCAAQLQCFPDCTAKEHLLEFTGYLTCRNR